MSLAETERAIDDFAARARDNRLRPEELADGTFTISNGDLYFNLGNAYLQSNQQDGWRQFPSPFCCCRPLLPLCPPRIPS
jgi:hypothetical protein